MPLSIAQKILKLLHTVTFFEHINTSACIYQFLLTGKERMAFRANFNVDIGFCGASGDLITADALNNCILVDGMDSFLHYLHSPFGYDNNFDILYHI